MAARRSPLHRLDELAEQRRAGEAGAGRARVQGENASEPSTVAPPEQARLVAQILPARDGQQIAHPSASSRVTVAR